MKHADLVAHSRGAAHARNLTRFVGSTIYRLDFRGQHHVPSTGPVILVANHLGLLDGPVLVGAAPRPVHTLSKSELFADTRMASLLRWAGHISIDYRQPDRTALRSAVATLRAGSVLGLFPEGHRSRGDASNVRRGIGYLMSQVQAPVVPVAILGTRYTGKSINWVPAPGSRIGVVFGPAVDCGPVAATLSAVSQATERVRILLRTHVEQAVQRVGIPVPDDVIDHPEDHV